MLLHTAGATSSALEVTKNGRHISASAAWTAAMMKTGCADRCVSCFWKTLAIGFARMRMKTVSGSTVLRGYLTFVYFNAHESHATAIHRGARRLDRAGQERPFDPRRDSLRQPVA